MNKKEVEKLNLELLGLNKTLEELRDQNKILGAKLSKAYNRQKFIKELFDKDIISKFPKNISRFSDKQWDFVLEHHHGISTVRYQFSTNIIHAHGWYTCGFHNETNQFAFALNKYMCNENFEKIKKDFYLLYNMLIKHLKPVTVDDPRHGIESGIRIAVSGLVEETTSVLYCYPKTKRCKLYKTMYGQPIDFDCFETFINWYREQKEEE